MYSGKAWNPRVLPICRLVIIKNKKDRGFTTAKFLLVLNAGFALHLKHSNSKKNNVYNFSCSTARQRKLYSSNIYLRTNLYNYIVCTNIFLCTRSLCYVRVSPRFHGSTVLACRLRMLSTVVLASPARHCVCCGAGTVVVTSTCLTTRSRTCHALTS